MRKQRCFAIWALAIAIVTARGQTAAHSAQTLTLPDVAGNASGSVVQIVTFDATGSEMSLGSGFIISADGIIVTNYHVIKGAKSANASLPNGSSFKIEAVLEADADKDLALLKVSGKGLNFLRIVSALTLKIGERVVAIGSPLGLDGSVSDGIVSSLRKGQSGEEWIQTTAPVSHGSSGGPLLNMKGKVVGVITRGVNAEQGQGLNFAISSDSLLPLISRSHLPLKLDAFSSENPTKSPDDSGSHVEESVGRNLLRSSKEEGQKALEAKSYELAVHAYKQALQIDSTDATAWSGLGLSHLYLDQYDLSVEDLKKAVKYDSTNKYDWWFLGISYRALGKNDEALSAFQEAVGIDPGYSSAWLELGKTYDALRSYDQSLRCYRQATLTDDNSAEAWFKFGVASHDDQERLGAFIKTVTIMPSYKDAWYYLGAVYQGQGRYYKAIEAWNNGISLGSKKGNVSDGELQSFIGDAYSKLGDLNSAEGAYQKAYEIQKSMPYQTKKDNVLTANILLSLSSTYDRMGNRHKAQEYRKAWEWFVQNEEH